jgi:hypothetical protein
MVFSGKFNAGGVQLNEEDTTKLKKVKENPNSTSRDQTCGT